MYMYGACTEDQACLYVRIFKKRGLIIADCLPCLILGGIYWHCSNVKSGAYVYGKGWVEWDVEVDGINRYPVGEKTPRGTLALLPKQVTTPCINYIIRQGQHLGDTLYPYKPIEFPRGTNTLDMYWHLSVLHGQDKAMWKSRPGHLLLFY